MTAGAVIPTTHWPQCPDLTCWSRAGCARCGGQTVRLSPLALAALEATCVSASTVLQKHSCAPPDVCYFSRPWVYLETQHSRPLLCARPSSHRSPSQILDYNWPRRNLTGHRFADAACVILDIVKGQLRYLTWWAPFLGCLSMGFTKCQIKHARNFRYDTWFGTSTNTTNHSVQF